jgi:hypothetical protein
VTRPFRMATLAGLIGLSVPGAGCAAGSSGGEPKVDPPVSVDRIRDTPDRYVGRRVRLGAAVAQQQDSRVFVLKDHDPAFKEHMLVITTEPLPDLLGEAHTTLKSGERLLLTGVVHREPLAALEGELGVQLEHGLKSRFEGTPVLVATEVVRTDDREPEPPDTAAGY